MAITIAGLSGTLAQLHVEGGIKQETEYVFSPCMVVSLVKVLVMKHKSVMKNIAQVFLLSTWKYIFLSTVLKHINISDFSGNIFFHVVFLKVNLCTIIMAECRM